MTVSVCEKSDNGELADLDVNFLNEKFLLKTFFLPCHRLFTVVFVKIALSSKRSCAFGAAMSTFVVNFHVSVQVELENERLFA